MHPLPTTHLQSKTKERCPLKVEELQKLNNEEKSQICETKLKYETKVASF